MDLTEESSDPEFVIWLRKAAEDKGKSKHSRKQSNLNSFWWKDLRPTETQDQDKKSEKQQLQVQPSTEVVQGE
jgi:hypothetical protein